MVIFDNIFIEKDTLIISARIEDNPDYDRAYIDSIIIDNQDTFLLSGPSSKPLYTKSFDNLPSFIEGVPMSKVDPILIKQYNTRSIRLALKISDLNTTHPKMASNLIFAYVVVGGVVPETLPCGKDARYHIGVAYDNSKSLSEIIQAIKRIDCSNTEISKELINTMLRFRAFDSSVKAGEYTTAIKYWNRFFKDRDTVGKYLNNCNCNGTTSNPI